MYTAYIVLSMMLIVAVLVMLLSAVTIIPPNECGVLIVLGVTTRILFPGFNMKPPLISTVYKIRMDSNMWESELNQFDNPKFHDKVVAFKTDVNRIYGMLAKVSRGNYIVAFCPHCRNKLNINLDDYKPKK